MQLALICSRCRRSAPIPCTACDGYTTLASLTVQSWSQVDLWLACSGLSSATSAYAELYAAAHGAAWELVGCTEVASHPQGRRPPPVC